MTKIMAIIAKTISYVFFVVGLMTQALGGYSDISQAMYISVKPWGLPLWLWGMVIFGVGCIIIIVQLQMKVNSYEKAIPNIKVIPVVYGNKARLKVKNNGATGIFDAEIHISSGYEYLEGNIVDYSPIWEKTNTTKSPINNGLSDCINIAEFGSLIGAFGGKNLSLFYYDYKQGMVNSIRSCEYIQIAEPISKAPEVVLEITISADKPIKGGVFTKRYKLSLFSLKECH